MGMCYDIMFKAKVKNEEKAVKALRKFIDNRDAFLYICFLQKGCGCPVRFSFPRIMFSAWP